MPIEILMPALSPTMEEGKLAKWLVSEGDEVRAGDVIAEIETDKATMEVEAVDEGRVGQILVAAGTDGVKVNMPIAVLVDDGEPVPVATAEPVRNPNSPQPPVTPSDSHSDAPTAQNQVRSSQKAASTRTKSERVIASPLARRLAETHNVDLISLQGSGPRGRIIKRDVDEAVASGAHQQSAARRATTARETAPSPDLVAPTPAPDLAVTRRTAPPVATVAPVDGVADASSDRDVLALYDPDTYDLVPHDGMRRTIATRLTQSKQTIPHFYQTVDIRLDQLLTARSRMNASAPTDGPRAFKLSVNDFVIKALALALQDVPAANASWTEGGMLRHRHSDVGVAVAVEGGLFTPIIRHAELKTLSEISNEMKDLANRARNRRLAPHEYQGGTTSISNLGMYGIKSFDAVINPPHATILAVGAGIEQPVVVEGQLTVATVMSCTLSADHRVVDGASGAELINAVKAYVEDPVRMLI